MNERHVTALVTLVCMSVLAVPSRAQTSGGDPAAFAAATVRARKAFTADRGRLWGVRLDTLEWMGAAGGTAYFSVDPHHDGYTRGADGLWEGPMPAGIAPSNTSVTWNGRRWAMVVLPLSPDTLIAQRVLVHEAMHVLQPSVLPLPRYLEGAAGAELLDEPDGRTWLRLEWRALAAALRAPLWSRSRSVRDALVFRAQRYALASDGERSRERALDVAEGIPEYGAWTLTRSSRADLAAALDSAPARLSSFVRGFPYYTGPAYAMLLDTYVGAPWRRSLRVLPDLQRELIAGMSDRAKPPVLVRRAIAGDSLSQRDRDELQRLALGAGEQYGIADVQSTEQTRWATRQREIAGARARFVTGPTVRVRPRTLMVSFDPNRQMVLGADGTVMANLVWKSDDGASLSAPDGALVTPTWIEIHVPLGDAHLAAGRLDAPLTVHGGGWTLELPAGWTVQQAGASWVVLPPA